MGNRLGGASQWVERVIEILFAFGVGGAKVEVFEVSDRFVGTASFKQSDTCILGRHPCGIFFEAVGVAGIYGREMQDASEEGEIVATESHGEVGRRSVRRDVRCERARSRRGAFRSSPRVFGDPRAQVEGASGGAEENEQ